jgi:hypothetical protein
MRGKMVRAWLLAGLAFGLAHGVEAGQAQPVKVGEWQLATDYFFSGHGEAPPLWRGTAVGPQEQRLTVSIGGEREPLRPGPLTYLVQLPGVGTVAARVTGVVARTAASTLAANAPTRPFAPGERVLRFTAERDGQTIAVEGGTVIPASLSSADELPPAALLKAMLRERIGLATRLCATDFPRLTATVDGGEPVALKSRTDFRGADCAWELPARPGQAVSLAVNVKGGRFVVTTQGIERTNAPDGLARRPVSLSQLMPDPDRKSWSARLDMRGDCVLDIGKLDSPSALSLGIDDGFGDGQYVQMIVLLRWGREEEQWLDDGRYPMADLPADASATAMVRALVSDLDTAFDPDTGGWFERWGSTRLYTPRAPDGDSVDGLEPASVTHPIVAQACEDVRGWMSRFELSRRGAPAVSWSAVTRPQLEECVEDSLRRWGGPTLWEPLQGQDGKMGWHHPRTVCRLALLWRRYAELRGSIPLEGILDFWCESMKTQPFPMGRPSMVGYLEDRTALSLACAAVALHVGFEALAKPEYAEARDRVLARMREARATDYQASWGIGPERPLYQVLVLHADPGAPRGSVSWNLADEIVRFAAVYGQTCAFIGNTEELGKVRDWTADVLAKKGDDGQKLYEGCYRQASFSTRCALLAAVRGLSPLFAGPPGPQAVVSGTGS